jgi:transposase
MVRYSREIWVGHVAAMKSSGQSAVAYAAEHDLPLKSLYQWRSKFRSVEAGSRVARPVPMDSSSAQQFVAVRVPPEVLNRSIGICSLVLGSGLRLEMVSLPEPDWLLALSRGAR